MLIEILVGVWLVLLAVSAVAVCLAAVWIAAAVLEWLVDGAMR